MKFIDFLISIYGKVTTHENNIKCSIKKFVYIRNYSKSANLLLFPKLSATYFSKALFEDLI